MSCQVDANNILLDNALYRVIYEQAGEYLPCWASYLVAGLAIMFILVNGVLLGAAVFSWLERRLLGRFHNRIGPNRWGPFGLLQPIADLLKLMVKEDLIPATADRITFTLVPIVMMMPVILVLAVVPFAKDTALANLNIGVLYVLAVTSLTTLAIFMAGWSSNNRYAMFGAARGVAMLISYEVPVVLSLLGVVMVAGSMSLADVVDAQTVPFLAGATPGPFCLSGGDQRRVEPHPFRPGGERVRAGSRLPYGVQRQQVRPDFRGGNGWITRRLGSNDYPVPQRLVWSGLQLPWLALVPAEAGGPGIHIYLDSGHLSPLAHRPDHGSGLEIPAAFKHD